MAESAVLVVLFVMTAVLFIGAICLLYFAPNKHGLREKDRKLLSDDEYDRKKIKSRSGWKKYF